MDPLIVLIPIAAVLLFYQVFMVKDPDKLDNYGHELRSRDKKN